MVMEEQSLAMDHSASTLPFAPVQYSLEFIKIDGLAQSERACRSCWVVPLVHNRFFAVHEPHWIALVYCGKRNKFVGTRQNSVQSLAASRTDNAFSFTSGVLRLLCMLMGITAVSWSWAEAEAPRQLSASPQNLTAHAQSC